jgi:hypothetical protein
MIRKNVWAISSICFLLHQILIYCHFSNIYLDSYLDPLVFIPTLIGGIEYLISFFLINFRIKTILIYCYTTIIAIIFEFVIPNFDHRFTADIYDCVAYFFGASVYTKTVFTRVIKS